MGRGGCDAEVCHTSLVTLFGGGRSEADALTQKDIDSLLQSSAAGAGVQRRPAVEVLPYNFLRPPRISKDDHRPTGEPSKVAPKSEPASAATAAWRN